MAHWYTADPHFGHDAILAHAGRPFRSIEHMDATLIERMWSRVGPEDDLWIVGDFAFGRKAKDEGWLLGLFGQLPGARKHLITGNHDLAPTLALPWDSIAPMAEVPDTEAERPVTLCHYPMITWNHARKGALHFFGHVHGNWRGSSNAVNVGVDVWDYAPVNAREAAARARSLPPNRHWQDAEPRAKAR